MMRMPEFQKVWSKAQAIAHALTALLQKFPVFSHSYCHISMKCERDHEEDMGYLARLFLWQSEEAHSITIPRPCRQDGRSVFQAQCVLSF